MDLITIALARKAAAAELANKANAIIDSASGAVASFPDGAGGVPVKSLVCTIVPAQSGSGDPSPENIRPISGWTGMNVSHSGADTSDPTVIPVSWQTEAGTVYGGTLDVTTGELTVTNAYIESYDDEALPGAWISDRDVYVEGATPTVGAQVVYELAEPIVYHIDPVEVDTLLGENNIWTDTGETSVDYAAETDLYIQKKLSANNTPLGFGLGFGNPFAGQTPGEEEPEEPNDEEEPPADDEKEAEEEAAEEEPQEDDE